MVERRDLTETATQSGTLGFSDTRAVVNRLGGTVTWLPGAGQTIRTGQRLYEVDGKPVILFNGTVPAYRNLGSGVSNGPDVRELERNLVALGYDPSSAITVDNHFTAATTSAIERWQRDVGLGATGRIALGRSIFLPGSRRISSISATLGGSTSGGSSSGTGSATASGASSSGASYSGPSSDSATLARSAPSAGAQTILVDYSTTSADTTTTTSQAGANTGTDTTGQGAGSNGSSGGSGKGSKGSKQGNGSAGNGKGGGDGNGTTGGKGSKSKGGSGRGTQTSTATQGSGSGSATTASGASSTGGSSSGSQGSTGQSAQQSTSAGATANTIMETTSDRQIVSVDLDASKQTLAHVRDRVSIQLPNNSYVNGRISRVSKVAKTSTSSSSTSSDSSSTTIPVTIKLTSSKGVTSLDQAPVTVQFAQSQRKGVLAIPVTALLAQPGGKYAVEVIGGQRRYRIPVTPGLYAGGYVEISGAGLQTGMKVSNATL